MGTAGDALRPEPFIKDVELGIDDHGYQGLLIKLQKDLELISIAAEQLGLAHFGLVDVLVIVVLLHHGKGLRQRCVWDEQHADPIVNQSVVDLDGMTVFLRVHLLNQHLSSAKLCVGLPPTYVGQLVYKQERSIVEFRADANLRDADVSVKRDRGLFLQFRRFSDRHCQATEHYCQEHNGSRIWC
jgi:hypothetical protein